MHRKFFWILFFLGTTALGQSLPFRTWDTRSACAWVEPATGVHFQLHFKKVHRNQERVLSEVRIGAREKEAEVVRPLGHASDGSYTELELDWQDESLVVESAQSSIDKLFVIRIIKKKKTALPLKIFVSANQVWNHKGAIEKTAKGIKAVKWFLQAGGKESQDFCLPSIGAHLGLEIRDTSFFWVGKDEKIPSGKALNELVNAKKTAYYQGFNLKDEKELARFAIQSCMAWNTIYDPGKNRVLHTVNRIWNVNRGGYVIFCWDNFFGSLLSFYGLQDTSLAFSNFRAVLEDATPEGFPSNNSQGNGRKAFDRSQPPVGSLVALELYEKTQSKAFVRSIIPGLYTWNRWWMARRMNGPLLSWGSHKAENPFSDPACHKLLGATLESGLDDSPMFDSAAFDSTRGLMMLHDVGLNALYLADCEHLIKLMEISGMPWKKEIMELKKSFSYFKNEIQQLYHPRLKLFVNRYLPSGQASRVFSPTHLYLLLTSGLKKNQVQDLIDSLLLHPQRLGGELGLPSIARNHPDFGKQQYWKGSIWPPLNFLVFKGLMKQNRKTEARDLADSSFQLFINEYKRAKLICENYSGMNGRCDDPLVNSEPYYFWGGLLAYMQSQL
jgi:putative isomerase